MSEKIGAKPTKPNHIKTGTIRSDGFRFCGFVWIRKYNKWKEQWASEQAYKRNRTLSQNTTIEYYKNKIGCGTTEYGLLRGAKRRAKEKGLPFNISLVDICVPDFCPILGIRLISKYGVKFHDGSPTLDRKEPDKGYVKGNIVVISNRANRIKSNATPHELRLVADFCFNQAQQKDIAA